MPLSASHPTELTFSHAQLNLPSPFRLSQGGRIEAGVLAYTLYGDLNHPCVLVLGGISASKDVAHDSGAFGSAWWRQHIGASHAINTSQYCVLSIDYLGGSGDSSSPAHSEHPNQDAITTDDQANAIALLLSHLGISNIYAIGASYGGMVIQNLLLHHPQLVYKALVISAAHKSTATATALRFLQRQLARSSLTDSLSEPLVLARALGMLTYRLNDELDSRFEGPAQITADGFSFPLLDYLTARGDAFARHFDVDGFCRLSESIDLHCIDPKRLSGNLTCVGVTQDPLIPITDITLLSKQAEATLIGIDSDFGHDAFLKEDQKIDWIVRSFLRDD